MKTVNRLDFTNSKLSNLKRTDQGFVHFNANITRAGVFKYLNADGTIRNELRPPEEVFDEKSMETAQNVPVTNNHPKEMVTAINAKAYSVGFTGDSTEKIDNMFLGAKVVITDQKGLEDVFNNGKVELSMGYMCTHDETPGVFDGQNYDVIQRNIRYNHLSIVDKGRAGSNVRLNLDADDAVMITDQEDAKDLMQTLSVDGRFIKKQEAHNMKSVEIKGIKHDVSDEFKKVFDEEVEAKSEAEEKVEAAETKATEAKAEVEAKDSEITKLTAKVDALEAEKEKSNSVSKADADASKLNELVKERVTLYDAAKKHCSEDVTKKLDGMSAIEIKKAVVKSSLKEDSQINLDEKDEIYISTRFDIHMETVVTKDASKELSKKVAESRKDGLGESLNVNIDKEWKKPLRMSKTSI